jgi:hypothetical protein
MVVTSTATADCVNLRISMHGFFEVSSRQELEQFEMKLNSITEEAALLEKEIVSEQDKQRTLEKLSGIQEQGGDYVTRLARVGVEQEQNAMNT